MWINEQGMAVIYGDEIQLICALARSTLVLGCGYCKQR